MGNSIRASFTLQRIAGRLRAYAARAAHTLHALLAREAAPQARVLIATSHAISAAPDIGQLLATVLDQLDVAVPSTSSAIHIIEGDAQRLVAFRAFPSAGPPVGTVWPRHSLQLTAEIAATSSPLVVPDVRADPRWVGLANMGYIRSWLGLPLLAQGEVLGFLMLDRDELNSFRQTEVELAGAFANQLALALRIARLATDNQRQLTALSALYDLSRTASASLALDQLIPELARRLRTVGDVEACVLALLNEDGELEFGTAGLASASDLDRPMAQGAAPFVRDIIATCRMDTLADIRDYATPDVALRALASVAGVLGMPLLAQGEAFGAVLFGYAQRGEFAAEVVRQAELAAGQAALAVTNARMLADAQRHARELALRDEIRMAVAAAPPTVEALAHSVTSSLVRTLGYTIVDCWEVNEAQLVLLSSCDVSMGWLHLPLTGGVCASVARSGQARLIADVTREPDYLPPVGVIHNGDHYLPPERAAQTIVSEMCVPVFDGARVALVLNVEHAQRLRGADMRLLSEIAAQVGLALEHVRLVSEIGRVQAERAQTARVSAVGTLAAGVAHEFNNMLAALIGYAQLGLTGTPEEQVEALQVVEQVARRGKHITSGLLSFAEPSAAHPTAAQLGDMCEQALRSIEHELIACSVEVRREYASDTPVFVDQGKIVQALGHLLSNARDAMPGGGTLTLRCAREQEWAILQVIDTGEGIVPAVRDHLFEPFVTTKGVLGGGSQGGVGLGLATAHGIVRRHGGSIDVTSARGSGSTFTVRLPLVRPELEEPSEPLAVRVLVAEDDDVMQAMLRAALERAGYDVTLTTSAASALARLQRGGIDVLVCDLALPDGESLELLRQLLAIRLTLPVILIAASGAMGASDAWPGTAVAGVIRRPFQVEAVLEALQKVGLRPTPA